MCEYAFDNVVFLMLSRFSWLSCLVEDVLIKVTVRESCVDLVLHLVKWEMTNVGASKSQSLGHIPQHAAWHGHQPITSSLPLPVSLQAEELSEGCKQCKHLMTSTRDYVTKTSSSRHRMSSAYTPGHSMPTSVPQQTMFIEGLWKHVYFQLAQGARPNCLCV